jgi:hypothetical protein
LGKKGSNLAWGSSWIPATGKKGKKALNTKRNIHFIKIISISHVCEITVVKSEVIQKKRID